MPAGLPLPDALALEAALVRCTTLSRALLDELRNLPPGTDPLIVAELQLQAADLAARVGVLLSQVQRR